MRRPDLAFCKPKTTQRKHARRNHLRHATRKWQRPSAAEQGAGHRITVEGLCKNCQAAVQCASEQLHRASHSREVRLVQRQAHCDNFTCTDCVFQVWKHAVILVHASHTKTATTTPDVFQVWKHAHHLVHASHIETHCRITATATPDEHFTSHGQTEKAHYFLPAALPPSFLLARHHLSKQDASVAIHEGNI